MRVLVTAASRHGSTTEIARRIGEVLVEAGIEADVRVHGDVASVESYDGVILGSGVYAGRWLGAAREFVDREAAALSSRPVWLFSSGPVGDPAKPAAEPVDVDAVRKRTNALDHRVFNGKLDRQALGFGERAIVLAVHAAEGDFRSWEAVTEWAEGIAASLQADRPAAEPVPTR
jgi:menaquinone-dependent protoporphyrinogen oxidase